MKPIRFLGDSLKRLREFPSNARQDAGYQLDKVQNGQQPDDLKPMPLIGNGVEEIRVGRYRDFSGDLYHALAGCSHVLHAFRKKTQATSKRDLEIAKARYAQLLRGKT